jgi:hypothetical protein
MGETRNALVELQKFALEIDQKINQLGQSLKKQGDQTTEYSEKISAGFEMLYLHLFEKFKKTGTTPEAQAGKKLKEVMDPGVLENVKGIQQWIGDLKGAILKLKAVRKIEAEQLLWTVTTAQTKGTQLKSVVEKKQAKWFKNSDYKEKLKKYTTALQEIDKWLKEYRESLNKLAEYDDSWVDKVYSISPDTTVGEIKIKAGAKVTNQLEKYTKQNENDNQVRRWRDSYKGVGGQLALMKKWSEEADKMDLVK